MLFFTQPVSDFFTLNDCKFIVNELLTMTYSDKNNQFIQSKCNDHVSPMQLCIVYGRVHYGLRKKTKNFNLNIL